MAKERNKENSDCNMVMFKKGVVIDIRLQIILLKKKICEV